MPLSPEWAKLPRRRCDDCGKTYKQVRPRREGEMGFCSDNCRKSYHKHGGAYRKLKVEMKKMLEKEFTGIHAELKELRALWIETESLYVAVSTRFDELKPPKLGPQITGARAALTAFNTMFPHK